MGGIVIKKVCKSKIQQILKESNKALILAQEDSRYNNILESALGVVFLGTPHDGADAAKFASTLAYIAKSLGIPVNMTNLRLLERDSAPLVETAKSFGYLSTLNVVTVVESNMTRIPHTGQEIMASLPSCMCGRGIRYFFLHIERHTLEFEIADLIRSYRDHPRD